MFRKEAEVLTASKSRANIRECEKRSRKVPGKPKLSKLDYP